LVNSLYSVYEDAHQGFAERYLEMLRAGGTLRHRELLAPFGLDAVDPAFWTKGLSVIAGFIDELERLGLGHKSLPITPSLQSTGQRELGMTPVAG
jgi:oligoendopeptidase F